MGARSRADSAALWLVSVLIVGVAANWVATLTQNNLWWAYLAAVVLVAAIVLTFPGGFFSRQKYGPTPLGRVVATIVLLGYLGAGPVLASSGQLLATIAGTTLLWLAAVLLTWRTVRTEIKIEAAALGVSILLFGVSFLLSGISVLQVGDPLLGGAAMLLGGTTMLFGVWLLRRNQLLFTLVFLLLGVTSPLFGVAAVRSGDTLEAVAVLLFGVGALLAASWSNEWLVGAAGLLFGTAGLLLGVAVLRSGETLGGVATMLGGVAILLLVVAVLPFGQRFKEALVGITLLLLGLTGLLLGVAVLRSGNTLTGVVFLLFGVSTLLFGLTVFWSQNALRRIGQMLSSRLLLRDP